MTLKELHDSLCDQKTQVNPQMLMDQVEANLEIIDKADRTNLMDYYYSMQLTSEYAISLENSGYCLKGLLYLQDAIDLMENYPNYQKDQLLNVQTYQRVLFHKARAFYHLKNYHDSQVIFKQLQKAFPDNENYRNWRLLNQVKKSENWIWNGIAVMFFTLILRFFINGQFPLLDHLIYWTLLLALIGTVTLLIVKSIEQNKVKRIDVF